MLAGAAIILYMSTKEKYESLLPTDDIQQSVAISSVDLAQLVQLVQSSLCTRLSKPVYPIETTYVRKTGDTYNCRFMFTVMGGYPYGLSVDADILNSQVVSLRFQEDNGDSPVTGFGESFVKGSEFVQVLPTMAQLRSVM